MASVNKCLFFLNYTSFKCLWGIFFSWKVCLCFYSLISFAMTHIFKGGLHAQSFLGFIYLSIFFLTWMMFDIVELRIKLLNYIRSVLNGPLSYMTLPFPETKLAHKHKQIIWNISSSYSMDLCPYSIYIFSTLETSLAIKTGIFHESSYLHTL